MYSKVNTAIVYGIQSYLVEVEADISDGMPVFEMVGFLGAEVKEAKERVRAALKNLGLSLPVKRITINLSPASLKKNGTGFDLPVAIALLSASGLIESESLKDVMIMGEISLNGDINPIDGVLPMVLTAKDNNLSKVVLPIKNVKEARLVSGIDVVGVRNLEEVIEFFVSGVVPGYEMSDEKTSVNGTNESGLSIENYDFSMIAGQKLLRRACEVAISGMHNMLMVGPPGAGKTMIAKCIPSIMPDLTTDEMLEITKIYSVNGLLKDTTDLIRKRPFRSPHHTISPQGLTGGGANPKPGEISLAHKGVLFLDELTEFNKSTIEILRQPLEEKEITISRVKYSCTFPSDFVLVTALNPCSCGYYPDLNKCHCSDSSISRYLGKLSQPLLDRIDICTEAPALDYRLVANATKEEDSKTIKERVIEAQTVQSKRYIGENFKYNSQIPSNKIDKYCKLNDKENEFMESMYDAYDLTARTYHKVLKVARTIADMSGEEDIKLSHLQEAICYRGLDKRYWRKR